MSKRLRDAGGAGGGLAAPRRHKKPRPEDLNTLSVNILALRDAAGWAQDELAHEAKLARSHVGALEKKRFDPRLSTLGALADAFKVRTGDLLLPAANSKHRGRSKVSVQLGWAKNAEIVRRLIESVPVDQSFEAIDWSDPKAVQSAWRRFLDAFARQIKK